MKWLDQRQPPAALTCVYCGTAGAFAHVQSFTYFERDFHLFRCPDCASLHYDPPEIVARIEHPYSEAYKANTRIGTKYFLEAGYAPELIVFCALAALAGRPPEVLAQRQFVDIGAGVGLSSLYVRDVCGIEPVVIEPAYMGELATELLGLDVQRAFFEHLPAETMQRLRARPCLLHLNSVIEHLSDPAEPMRQALAAVEVDVFAAIVPDADILDPSAPFTAMLPTLAPGDHLHLPTRAGMERFIRRLGFDHVAIATQPGLLIAVGARAPIILPDAAAVAAGTTALLNRLLGHPNPVIAGGAAARLLVFAMANRRTELLGELSARMLGVLDRKALLLRLRQPDPWSEVPFHICTTGYALATSMMRDDELEPALAWLDVVDAASTCMAAGEYPAYAVQSITYGWAARLLRAHILIVLGRFEEVQVVLRALLAARDDRVNGPSQDQLAAAAFDLARTRGLSGLLLRARVRARAISLGLSNNKRDAVQIFHPISLLYYLYYSIYYIAYSGYYSAYFVRSVWRDRDHYIRFTRGFLRYHVEFVFHAVMEPLRLAPARAVVALRRIVAGRRDNLLSRALAAAARKFLRARDNAHNADIASNGEAFLLREVLPHWPGDVLDIGAQDGPFSALAASLPGTAQVHAFDPDAAQLEVFRARCTGRHVRLNDFIPRDGDAYVAAHAGARIAVLRLSVPGQEHAVLAGFAATLAQGMVGAVRFAHGPANAPARVFLADLVAPLAAAGFTVFHLLPDRLRPCLPLTPEDEDFAGRAYVALAPALVRALAHRITA